MTSLAAIEPFEVVLKHGRLINSKASLASNFRWISGRADRPPLHPPATLTLFDSYPTEYRSVDLDSVRSGLPLDERSIRRTIDHWVKQEIFYRSVSDRRRDGAIAAAGLISAPAACPMDVFEKVSCVFFEKHFLDFDVVGCLRSDKPYPIYYFTYSRLYQSGNDLRRINFSLADLQSHRQQLAEIMYSHELPARATTRRERGLGFVKHRKRWQVSK